MTATTALMPSVMMAKVICSWAGNDSTERDVMMATWAPNCLFAKKRVGPQCFYLAPNMPWFACQVAPPWSGLGHRLGDGTILSGWPRLAVVPRAQPGPGFWAQRPSRNGHGTGHQSGRWRPTPGLSRFETVAWRNESRDRKQNAV